MEWEKGRLLEKGNNVTLEKAAGMCGRRTVFRYFSPVFRGFDPVLKDGYILNRNPLGQEEETYLLEVRGLADSREPERLELILEAEQYTEKEAEAVYEQVIGVYFRG